MRLTDLDPEFIRWEDRVEPTSRVAPGYDTGSEAGMAAWRSAGFPTVEVVGPVTYIPQVQTLSEAQGVEFDCPKCTSGHRIAVAFAGRGVLDHQASRDKAGRPTRWQVSGTSLGDLTLSPSVDCTGSDPNCWHGFVTNGEIK
jgi:hypothetical protein